MPPNARKAPRRGGEGGESSNVVRSEDDGSNEERDAARERKAALRNQHLNVLRELRERGKKMLLEGGMQQLRTEGVASDARPLPTQESPHPLCRAGVRRLAGERLLGKVR